MINKKAIESEGVPDYGFAEERLEKRIDMLEMELSKHIKYHFGGITGGL